MNFVLFVNMEQHFFPPFFHSVQFMLTESIYQAIDHFQTGHW